MDELTTGARPSPSGVGILELEQYREVFLAFDQGFCIFQVLVDEDGRPCDYRFLEVNHTFEALTGLHAPVGRTALELVPDLEPHWIEIYGRVALSGESTRFEQGSVAMGRWFDVHAARIGPPEKRLVALLFNDITAHRREQEERRRAEEALRASEHRFREFADTAPAMLWVTEADGACSYLSRGWFAFTGQTPVEGLGFGWLDAVHPADREQARTIFIAATLRRTAFALEYRARRADGAYRWVLAAGQPRLHTDGTFHGFVGSVIDIHDRKLAEHRLELTVDAGRVGLWHCDLPFDVLVWNRQVKEHFGVHPDTPVTFDLFLRRLHPDDREPTLAAIETALTGQTTFDHQYRTIGEDGQTRWVRAVGRADYEDGRPARFDGVTIDVTELVTLREKAEGASRVKDEFLAMLGHELRNPLAPILTALQLLKLRGVEAGERERAIIERQVRHVVGLVDDLLDVSRITRGRIDLRKEPVDPADIVARGVEIASPLLEQQRHVLEVDVPRGFTIEADPGRLAQVVANLLTNAAKYTEPGGRVSVTARPEGNEIALRVRDTGFGIDARMLPRIFDLFVQERQTLARSQGGLGLGLAIVRSLVELHGGTVSAASSGTSAGSEFTVRLPLHERTSAAPGSEPSRGTARRPEAAVDPAECGARVLIVDDNEDAATLMGTLLHALGYEARVVHDGPSALAEAERFAPQLALVDLGLPVMDGFDLAQRFRGHPTLGRTTLIAVTGYGQARDRDMTAHAGFSAHLTKPVDVDELRTVLATLAAQPPHTDNERRPR
jgi:PAS domain S-box-containing protein